jgi:hypothetical protein
MIKGWTAGIIDGEGCLGIYRFSKYSKRPIIQVGNTDIRILEELRKNWGGIIYEVTRKDRPTHKRIWTWRLYGEPLFKFLIRIEPYLISKKEKANELIKFYNK